MNRVDELLAAHAPWALSEHSWPLTPFERFMWFDDRPDFPLVFQVDLCFDGPIDPQTMREAFRFAIGRHPLLRSTVQGSGCDAAWVASTSDWPELRVFSKAADDEPGLAAIDLTASPGLRGWMRETSVGWDIKLLFHHACCDGQGARMFIQDMVLAYAVLQGVSEHRSPSSRLIFRISIGVGAIRRLWVGREPLRGGCKTSCSFSLGLRGRRCQAWSRSVVSGLLTVAE